MGSIYPIPQKAAVEECLIPLAPDSGCRRCSLAESAKTVCLSPGTFEEGALFVHSERPGGEEDKAGEAQVGKLGSWLREQIGRWWDGPVVFDNAVRCFSGAKPTASQIASCRPFVAWLLRQVRPSRILCLGSDAVLSILGRSVHPLAVRGGYGWLGERNVPVFQLMHPAFAMRNRFAKASFLRDLKWSLRAAPPTLPPWEAAKIEVEDETAAERCAEACLVVGGCAYDCEASGVQFEPEYRLLSVSVTPRLSDDAFVWTGRGLANSACRAVLRRLMEDPRVEKDGHNLKYDALAVILGLGADFAGYGRDTRLERKLLESDADGRLEVMQELVGMGGAKDESQRAIDDALSRRPPPVAEGQESLFGTPEKRASDDRMKYVFGEIPEPILLRRNATDSISTRRLDSLLWPQIESDADLLNTWNTLFGPSTEALVEVERAGIKVNVAGIEAADEYFRMKQEELLSKLRAYGDVNWDSPEAVAELLFERLKLPVQEMTAGGRGSTGKDSLEALKAKHPVVPLVLDYRWYSTERNRYGCGSDGKGGLKAHIRSDGRIHPTFDPMGTRMGRLACRDPNLQNITREEREDGNLDAKMIRDAFVAEDGYVLLEADQSQIELRAMAYLSGDPAMIEIFKRGEDVHQRTAELISEIAWHIKPSEVRKPHRTKAKIFNFSLAFGKGDSTLAEELGISLSEAKRIRTAIYGSFGRLRQYQTECLAYARKHGEVWTMLDGRRGRCRALWDVAANEDNRRVTAEHGAFHTPVSGTAAHWCLRNLIECVRWIREDAVPARLILTVHDSFMFEVRKDCVPEVAWQVKRIMEQHPMGEVPLVADLKAGPSWGSLKKYAVE